MYILRLCIVVFFYCCIYSIYGEQKVPNFKIWGPGLNPTNIVMPARYFFIKDQTDSRSLLSDDKLKIFIQGTNQHNIKCQIVVNTLDRKDGSMIVRYRVKEPCYKFIINITYNNKHINGSPFSFEKPIYPEECNCPENDITSWLNNYQCKETYMQIEKDLIPFSSVNLTSLKPKILEKYNKPHSFSICNYVIVNNEIYRQCYGQHVGFKIFMDSILLSLARKVKLPDVELFVNLGDWPLAPKNKKSLPIFSWCGSDDTYDIVMPTYDVTESTLENMGRVMLDMLSIQGNIKYPWAKKIPKVFWRGRDSSRRRLDLIDIGRKYPDLFNVSLVNFFFFRNEMDKYGPKSPYISFFEFFNYKYQLNLDGTVAAYRFPYLLAGDSLVLKQDSKYYEWFYKSLKPDVHYLQVNEDLSNLVDRVQWAIDNDQEAKNISLRGQKFARNYLLPQNIFCYYAVLLKKWSEKLISPVEILDEMEHVLQPKPNINCDCNSASVKDEL